MIKKSRPPEAWAVPEWHADYGDARSELEHLRSFAIALLSTIPDSRVELEVPEPGLMNLAVELPDGGAAEVYSVPGAEVPGARRYGVFLAPGTRNEREIYEESVGDALNCLTGPILDQRQ